MVVIVNQNADMNTDTPNPLVVERVRHALKRRQLRVQGVQRLGGHFLRMRFAGDDLGDFVSASFDDHIKLMLPVHAGAEQPVMRDYTPRAFDTVAGTLDIEFLLHGDGAASEWASRATEGDEVGVGGPRGSFVVPMGFDWHLLVGDETALPAIARRLEELPAGAKAVVVVETGSAQDERDFTSRATVQPLWLRSGATATLADAVAGLALPAGEGFAWAAGEAASIAAVRQALVGVHGLDKGRVRASAYWKRGSPGHHEAL